MTTTTSQAGPSVEAAPRAAAARLYFLDHLRGVIILLVIVLHTAMTYMAYGPEWWYVIEPQQSLLYTALVVLLDVANMQILFFIAGFFAYSSLQKRGPRAFVRQKLVRIGLPWVVGVVFLAPLVTYLIPLTRGPAMGYLQFWAGPFWGPYYQQSVYWFLGILLLLFVVLAAFYRAEPSLRTLPREPRTPDALFFVKFLAFMTLWHYISSLAVGPDAWMNSARLFVFQPARLLLYAGYFVLGIMADRRGWFRPGGWLPQLDFWLPAAVISAIAYLGFKFYGPDAPGLLPSLIESILFNLYCLAGLMALTALFYRYANRPSPVWNSLSRNAFAIYYLHPIILYPAAYLALGLDLSIAIEPLLLMLLTALVCWGLGALVLTRLPVLRDIF